MSTNLTSAATAPAGAAPAPVRRLALTLLVALGPLGIALVRALLPYGTGDSSAAVVAKTAAQPGALSAVLWLTLLAGFTLVPGVIAVGRYAARRSRALGTAGLVISAAGFSGLPAIVATDQLVAAAAAAGLPADVTARLLDHLVNQPAVAVATMIFVVGHVLGVALLGIALWRGGVLPGWAGFVLAISQVAHLVFAVIVPNPLLDGCAWLLTAAGFAFAVLSATSSR